MTPKEREDFYDREIAPALLDDPQFIPYRCEDCGFTVHHPFYVRSDPQCPKCAPERS